MGVHTRGIVVKRYRRHFHAMAHHTRVGGFSFVELMVTVTILFLISGVILVGHNRFTGTTLIHNLAHDIGLSIRLAQSYSLNVRGYNPGSVTFNTSYGIHFEAASPTSYILFADPNRAANGFVYVLGTAVETFTLSQGYTIENVCATLAGAGNNKCFSGGGGQITFMDIVFDRPNPDAYFTSNVNETYERVDITVRSPQGSTRLIQVLQTGFVNVQ